MKIKTEHRRRIDRFIHRNGEQYRRLIMQGVEQAQIGLLDIEEALEDLIGQSREHRLIFSPPPDCTTRFLRVELTKTRVCENALAGLVEVAA